MRTELDCARLIVGSRQNPTVLELGAHHGIETAKIYDACKPAPGCYIAVEADPVAFNVLARNLRGRRVSLVNAAIADHSGRITFHCSGGKSDASGSIRAPKEHLQFFPDVKFDSSVEVDCIALNELASEYKVGPYARPAGIIDLIWCDIQGAERDMVLGGYEALGATRYLMAEADRYEMYEGQAKRDDLIAMLPDWDVVAEWPENANLLFRNRAFIRKGWAEL